MKRNPEPEPFENLKKIYPILCWTLCSKCGLEFKREWGWSAVTEPYIFSHGTTRHLCKDCAPDLETANQYFLNKEWKTGRPEEEL